MTKTSSSISQTKNLWHKSQGDLLWVTACNTIQPCKHCSLGNLSFSVHWKLNTTWKQIGLALKDETAGEWIQMTCRCRYKVLRLATKPGLCESLPVKCKILGISGVRQILQRPEKLCSISKNTDVVQLFLHDQCALPWQRFFRTINIFHGEEWRVCDNMHSHTRRRSRLTVAVRDLQFMCKIHVWVKDDDIWLDTFGLISDINDDITTTLQTAGVPPRSENSGSGISGADDIMNLI